MATFVIDTFSGEAAGTDLSAHTGEAGTTWTALSGEIRIAASGRCYNVHSAGHSYYRASGSPATAEYDVELDVIGVTTLTVSVGVAGRIDDVSNLYFGDALQGTGLRLFKRVAGTFTQLGSYATTVDGSYDARLRLEIRDDAKKLYENGVQRISSADNVLTAAGNAGVRADGVSGSTTGLHFDNLTATDAGGTTETTDPYYAVEIWNDLEAAGGQRKAVVPLVEGSMTRSVDNADRLTFSGVDSTEWTPHATLRSVARVRDWLGGVHEWRISGRERSRGENDGITTIQAVSPLTDLGFVDLIHDESTGGQKFFNLGGIGLTPAQYLETYASPVLERQGSTYAQLGSIDPTDQLDIAWDRWTPLQLAQELRNRTETELEYARDGSTGYNLNLLNERGSTADTRLLRVGRNLEVLRHKEQLEHLRTVVVPSGMVVPGAIEAAGIGQAAWRVDSYAATTDGDGLVGLTDPSSGAGPIAFNDQLAGLWLLRPGLATLYEVTSASTTQFVRVASTDAFGGTEQLEFRASSDGQYLAELTNPAQAASSAYGRILGLLNQAGVRGERNYIRNGLFNIWPTSPTVAAAIADGASTGTSLDLKDLPPSFPIEAFDVLRREQGTTSQAGEIGIVSDVVASTAGSASILLRTSAAPVSNGEVVWVFAQDNANPTGWNAAGGFHATNVLLFQRYDPSITGNVSGVSDGTNGGTTGARFFQVRGLPESAEIQAGDVLQLDTTGTLFRICGSITATTAGVARLPIFRSTGLPIVPATTDGAAVTVVRPTVLPDQPESRYYLTLHAQNNGPSTETNTYERVPYIDTPYHTFRYDSTLPVAWASVGLSYHSIGARSLMSTDPTFTPLKVDVWNGPTSSVVATITDEDRTLSAMTVQSARLQTSLELSSDTTLALRIHPPILTAAGLTGEPHVFIRDVSFTLGPDPDVPPIDGSHGNRLWQSANEKLLDWSRDPDVFEIAVRDVSAIEGYTSTDEALILGGTVTLFDPDLDINKSLRVVQITHDLADPQNTRVLLANRPKLLTSSLAGSRNQSRVVVQVDVAGTTSTGGMAGAGVGVPISSAPEVRTSVPVIKLDTPNEMVARQTGAYRAVTPSSGASTGSVSRSVFLKD